MTCPAYTLVHFPIKTVKIALLYISDLTLPPVEKMKKKLDLVGKEFLQAVYSEGKARVHRLSTLFTFISPTFSPT